MWKNNYRQLHDFGKNCREINIYGCKYLKGILNVPDRCEKITCLYCNNIIDIIGKNLKSKIIKYWLEFFFKFWWNIDLSDNPDLFK